MKYYQKWMFKLGMLALLVGMLGCCVSVTRAQDPIQPQTDWFKDAKLGAFMHFLPGNAEQFARVEQFDVNALAAQLTEMGATYFVITLQQNSGYINAPNATYDRYTGYKPGEKCSTRDLPLDLYNALNPLGIKLMLYIPAQVPNRDIQAQKAFGLKQGPSDQPIDTAFAQKWAEVLQEWSDRYGDKVAGWWFDGCYQWVNFNESIAEIYATAIQHGNPKAIVAFNPGVKVPVIRASQFENYTAGELNDPLEQIPTERWLKGAQWHTLTYMGTQWGSRNIRYTDQQWIDWFRKVVQKEGVVTLDMGPNYDPQVAPVGTYAPEQVAQFKAIRAALHPKQKTHVVPTSPEAGEQQPLRIRLPNSPQ